MWPGVFSLVPLCAHAVVPANTTTSALAMANDFECMMISPLLTSEALYVQNALSVVGVPQRRAGIGTRRVPINPIGRQIASGHD
jgi:hypothetical protein